MDRNEVPIPRPAPRQRLWPLHPLLFAAFPVVSLLAHNRHEVPLAWAVVPTLLAIGMALVFWGAFALVLRDIAKGALPASLAMLLFFSFGHLVVPNADVEATGWQTAVLQVLIAQGVVLLIVCAVLNRCGRPVVLTRFANLAAVAVMALPVISIVRYDIADLWRPSPAARAGGAANLSGGKPDIYLIIPDAHARPDVMLEHFGYDMEPFIAELESLGFTVPRQSAANYSMTPVSLASMLNHRYLEEHHDLAFGELRPFISLIRNAGFVSRLSDAGYKTVAFPTSVSYTEMRHFDEYYHGHGAASGFYRLVADLTPLSVLLADNPGWNALISDRQRILLTLDSIAAVADDPQPTFTFVHVQIPHPPFQFGEDGQDTFADYRTLADDGITARTAEQQERYVEAYRRQAIYTDRRLAEIAGEILARSEAEPVILIMSDHGPRLNFHWGDDSQTDAREALGNFTAVYLPGGRAAELVYPTITPVNVMRLVLGEVLGERWPLLADRSYLSSDAEGRHQLADVTSRVREGPRLASPAQPAPHEPVAEQEPGPPPARGLEEWLSVLTH